MLKFILVIALLLIAYTQLAPSSSSHKENNQESEFSTNKVDKFKRIGQRVNKNTKAFKQKANDYIYKFGSVSTRKAQTEIHAAYSKFVQEYYKNTFQHRQYSNLNSEEEAMYTKLKDYMNKSFLEAEKLSYDIQVASAAAKTRAYNRECGKRA